MAEIRKEVMSLMRKAIEGKQSRTSFLRDMKAKGLTYPRKRMVADWTQLTDFHAKAGALQRVRRDAFPSVKSIVTTDWDIAGTYMFYTKVKTRLTPEAPITEMEVSIVSDEPMTPRMVEQAVVDMWAEWKERDPEKYEEELIEAIPMTAIRTTL